MALISNNKGNTWEFEEGKHPCSQEVTLNTICMKITAIEENIERMAAIQEEYVKDMLEHSKRVAKYPLPEDVWEADRLLRKHDTYFKFLSAGLMIAWGVILFILDKVIIWNK